MDGGLSKRPHLHVITATTATARLTIPIPIYTRASIILMRLIRCSIFYVLCFQIFVYNQEYRPLTEVATLYKEMAGEEASVEAKAAAAE